MSGTPPGHPCRPGLLRILAVSAAVLLAAFPASSARSQEKTVTLSFTKELLYNIARDNEGEMTDEIVGRLKGLSPSVEKVSILRSGGEITLDYVVVAGDDLTVNFGLTLDKLALYRMAAAREDIDGMLKILAPARAREPLILELSYRYNEHYSIVDLVLDLRPAMKAKEKEMREAAAALAPPPPPAPPPAPPARKEPPPPAPKKEPPPPAPKKADQKKAAKQPEQPPAPAYLSAAALGKSPPPIIDGRSEDKAWSQAAPFSFSVKGESGNVTVTSWALWGGGKVYLLFRWPDKAADLEHRPWTWSADGGEYVVGNRFEDGLALQFSLNGTLGDCMLSGRESVADLWYWRAARTDPVGFAEDGTMKVSLQRIPKANFHQAGNGRTVWIKESRDEGSGPYRTQVAGAFEGELVRRYIPREPSGSVADVRAKGRWEEGTWTVEFSRSMSTDDKGDVTFRTGKKHYFSVAVFNGRERSAHSPSGEHVLQLD